MTTASLPAAFTEPVPHLARRDERGFVTTAAMTFAGLVLSWPVTPLAGFVGGRALFPEQPVMLTVREARPRGTLTTQGRP